ncbi:MAG: RES family NAD+ phosphorylase [Nakamurella sp.]
MTGKLPRPPADLATRDPAWRHWPSTDPLWHIANTRGPFATRFGVMRSYGPLASARFDTHPSPAGEHPVERVLYAAGDLVTAIAERFQSGREIRCQQPTEPIVYSWMATRPLELIDITDLSALRLGASQLLSTGPKRQTRVWAAALRTTWPAADGLLYQSSMAGRTCVALWAPALDSFPAAPAFAKLLADPAPAWIALLRNTAAQIHYDFFR